MRVIRWLGHATTLIEVDGMRVLTDPLLVDRVGPLVRLASVPRPTVEHPVDAVLLSHLHADHADLRSLRRLDPGVIVAPPGSANWLNRHGLRNVRELSSGQSVRIGDLRISATPARHPSGRWPLGANTGTIGFLVRGSITIYFAGDTDLFEGMTELRGSVTVALLPVAGWGRRLGPGHLDPERAAQAAALIRPELAVPIHWGTIRLGLVKPPDDPARPAREFAAFAHAMAPGVDVRVLAPGERLAL